MSPAQITPVQAGSERDTEGRLVGLVFDSTPPLQAPDANPWLVAVDSSENALLAVPPAPTFSQPLFVRNPKGA